MFSPSKKSVVVSGRVPEQEVEAPAQKDVLLKTAARQSAIFNSKHFSGIVTNASGLVQSFSPDAQRLLGYTAGEVAGKLPMVAFHDPLDLDALASALSLEFSVPVEPGMQALVFRAVRGLDDAYELDLICRDGSRFPGLVTVLPLLDDAGATIGYLLIPAENTARVQSLDAALARQSHQESESRPDWCAAAGVISAWWIVPGWKLGRVSATVSREEFFRG